MASSDVSLGILLDPEDDEIEVLTDRDGCVVLRWVYGADIVLGPVAPRPAPRAARPRRDAGAGRRERAGDGND